VLDAKGEETGHSFDICALKLDGESFQKASSISSLVSVETLRA
jgi:hypothetical protein